MQAIEVKFLGPTYARGSRWQASCAAKTRAYSQEILDAELSKRKCSISSDNRAKLAAEMLRNELGWGDPYYGRLVMGNLKNGNYVFVFTAPGS